MRCAYAPRLGKKRDTIHMFPAAQQRASCCGKTSYESSNVVKFNLKNYSLLKKVEGFFFQSFKEFWNNLWIQFSDKLEEKNRKFRRKVAFYKKNVATFGGSYDVFP